MNFKKCVSVLSALLLGTVSYSQEDLTLWYNRPAANWCEALPIGNSHMGAMVFGGTATEELQLNEESFWSGGPHNNDSQKSKAMLSNVRELIFEGKTEEAQRIIDTTFFTGQHGMRYLTLGSVMLNFAGHENPSAYYRDLNLSNAISTTQYEVDGVKYKRETFASFTDQVVIMRITADKPHALRFKASYQCPLPHKVYKKENKLILACQGVEHEGVSAVMRAECQMQIKTNGKILFVNNEMQVSGATEAIIYLSAATNFVNYHDVSANESRRAASVLQKALKVPYEKALANHVARYKTQFDRVALELEQSEASKNDTPTRVARFNKGQDMSLAALLFQYGRYLLISSSQPGGQPANLQGIWNKELYAPWDSKYTININTEMNYWPAEVANLSECHDPLFGMLDDLSKTGAQTAQTMYGCRGWVAHHNTDLWRVCGPIDGTPWGMFPNGGAWLAQHIWQHYLYTGDKDFLIKYYSILKGTADFYLDFLVEHPQYHWMVTVPSVSPEHGPQGSSSNLTAGCTMDNQIAFDALSSTLQAAKIVADRLSYQDTLQQMLDKLPPMQIGQYNQLQEWLGDWDDPRDEHRHISHLYGLYPSNQVSPYSQPELFQAAKNTLLQRGDMATGWSIGWKINFWARLLDGNHAYKIVCNMLKLLPGDQSSVHYFEKEKIEFTEGRTYPNLFTAHPPFQIDGNFGYTAGVAEMLLQSHDGAVHLLPALPESWRNGRVKGLVARGCYVVDMQWNGSQLETAVIHSKIGGTIRIRSYVPLNAQGLRKASGECPNPLLASAVVKEPLISKSLNPQLPLLYQVYEYDIDTKAGESYILTRSVN